MIFNEEFETLPRPAIEALQLKRLQDVAKRVYERVPFYKKKFDEAGFKPNDIKSIDDLQKLPFTEKQDLRDNYPFGLFTVPMEDVVRIHASSGTTGKATVVGYTKKDIELWAELIARTLSAAGATKHDIVHNAYGYGLVYRRPGFTLRSRTSRGFGYSDIGGQHQAPDHDHAGFRIDDTCLHAVLRPLHGRGRPGNGS